MVTYGTSAAPFLATRCLKKLADDNQTKYPKVAQILSKDFYVDDLLSGTTTTKEAIQLHQELLTLLQTAGFTLRKWASNNQQFLDTIPEEFKGSTRSKQTTKGYIAIFVCFVTKAVHIEVVTSLTTEV